MPQQTPFSAKSEGANQAAVDREAVRRPPLNVRTAVIACGARYRKLAVPDIDQFEGRGAWYWASPIEARLCRHEEIVLGGGNSAGQAAVYLRDFAARVWMLVRHSSLSKSMSRSSASAGRSAKARPSQRNCIARWLRGDEPCGWRVPRSRHRCSDTRLDGRQCPIANYAIPTRHRYRTREDHAMDVGFIGLGQMGNAMATNLIKAGHRLIVWNRTRSKAEALAATGARIADHPADAARADVVITMLADDDAVIQVVFGSDGVLAALAKDAVHISMSTISIALSDRLTEVHRKAGQVYAAAPVFGRPEAAAAAKLYIVAAGPEPVIARCQSLFDALGQKTFAIGEKPSMANVIKLSGNFMIALMLEGLGETVALVRKSGIDPHRYVEILTGSLFSAPLYKTYGSIIADEKYRPAGFKMSLGLKDMRLALAAAEAKMVPMPAASLVHDHFLAGVAQGQGDIDWSGLAQICAREAGIGP